MPPFIFPFAFSEDQSSPVIGRLELEEPLPLFIARRGKRLLSSRPDRIGWLSGHGNCPLPQPSHTGFYLPAQHSNGRQPAGVNRARA